jgi:hypothetical protein
VLEVVLPCTEELELELLVVGSADERLLEDEVVGVVDSGARLGVENGVGVGVGEGVGVGVGVGEGVKTLLLAAPPKLRTC